MDFLLENVLCEELAEDLKRVSDLHSQHYMESATEVTDSLVIQRRTDNAKDHQCLSSSWSRNGDQDVYCRNVILRFRLALSRWKV